MKGWMGGWDVVFVFCCFMIALLGTALHPLEVLSSQTAGLQIHPR